MKTQEKLQNPITKKQFIQLLIDHIGDDLYSELMQLLPLFADDEKEDIDDEDEIRDEPKCCPVCGSTELSADVPATSMIHYNYLSDKNIWRVEYSDGDREWALAEYMCNKCFHKWSN